MQTQPACDWRSAHHIALATPASTDDLRRELARGPLAGRYQLQVKYDGHAVSIELGPGHPPIILGRGRTRNGKFQQIPCPRGMESLRTEKPMVLVAEMVSEDGSLRSVLIPKFGSREALYSTPARTSRRGGTKWFMVHDLLLHQGKWLPSYAYSFRWHTLLHDVIPEISRSFPSAPISLVESYPCYDGIGDQCLSNWLSELPTKYGLEGFVLKPEIDLYPTDGDEHFGWKIKARDTLDVVVSSADKVQDGRVRSVRVYSLGNYAGFSFSVMFDLGTISLPESASPSEQQFAEVALGQVLEIDHQGIIPPTSPADSPELRQPRFVRWRSDKPARECRVTIGKEVQP